MASIAHVSKYALSTMMNFNLRNVCERHWKFNEQSRIRLVLALCLVILGTFRSSKASASHCPQHPKVSSISTLPNLLPMTTVERYRPPHKFHSDAPSNGPTTHSSSNSIVRNIPPAVPSPPRLSRNSPPPRPNTTFIVPPLDTMAVDQLSQWLFTPDQLRATPSMCDGLDPAEERCRRAKGVNFIIQVGILLKLPQMTIGVASTFFHRFYMRRSMVEKKGGLHHYVSSCAIPGQCFPTIPLDPDDFYSFL